MISEEIVRQFLSLAERGGRVPVRDEGRGRRNKKDREYMNRYIIKDLIVI